MKTFFEMSYEEWRAAAPTEVPDSERTRVTWRDASDREWKRIQTSLEAVGHWHNGVPCITAQCESARLR